MKVSVYEKLLPSGKVSFYLHYTYRGQRHKENLNLGTFKKGSREYKEAKRTASILKGRRLEDLISETHDLKKKQHTAITVHGFFWKYSNSYTRKDKRKVTALYENYIKPYFKKDLLLSALNSTDCEKFLDYLKGNLKNETTKNYYGLFRRALNQAVSIGLLQINPSRDVRLRLPSQMRLTKDVLNIEELRTLYRTPCSNELIKKAFLFACNTGITKAEIEKLRWKDIKGGIMSYDRLKTNGSVRVDVHLNKNALSLIGKPGKGEIFGKLPTSNGINKSLKAWVKKAGIDKHITFYCARHTFGTLQALNGVNQMVIAKNMGHSSTKRTDLYVNHVDEAKQRAVQFPEML